LEFIIKNIIWSILFVSCTSLVYQPDHYFHADPHDFGILYSEFNFNSADGTKLMGWDLKSKGAVAENLVLMFHGNAENLSSHVFNLTWLLDYKSDILIFDYRGYGLSEGNPFPKGVMEDGIAFLNYAHDKFKSGHYKKMLIYTQSLGGTIAMKALENISWASDISLLILDSTFISPRQIAADKTFGLLGWLISSDYTADRSLKHLSMPLLVIHSPADPVISYKFGLEIFETAPSTKKKFWKIDGGSHGDVFFVDKGAYRNKFLELIAE
jgi:fermentation-respiration switch protein FrsA (DUF1100 family)